MPVKILVADDSATMRRIMDMTFGGEDAQVVTVDSGDAAVDKALEIRPDVAFIDVSMDGMDGYDTARAMKERPELESTAVVLMASQQRPFDEARGRESGVDDHIFKPFDTQYVIDRVQELLSKPRAAAAPRPAASAPEQPAPQQPGPQAPPPPRPAPPPPAGSAGRSVGRADTIAFAPGAPPPPPARQPAAPPSPAASAQQPSPARERSSTAQFGAASASATSEPARQPEPPEAAPEPPPEPEAPDVQPSEPAPEAPAAAAASQATSPQGDLAQRLHGLGLSREQVEAVLALSRDVIEQVVWEVVPDLAETLIREEIDRLTRE